MRRAKDLIIACKESGADIAKFQLRNTGQLYRENQIEDLGVEYNKDLLDKYNLTFEQHAELSNFCSEIGIEYMCTPWDALAVLQLEALDVKRYKVASADFDNIPLLQALVDTGKPLILSTGMSSVAEIEYVCEWLNERNAEFTILHCNSTYPAPFQDIELNFLHKLKTIHKSVGYSGHERGIAVSVAAVALGATVLERHITLDKNLEGPDHQASLLPDEFNKLRGLVDEIIPALGDINLTNRKLSQGSLLNRENLGKSIVYSTDLNAGHTITSQDLEIRSPGQGVSPLQLDKFIGKKLTSKVDKHSFLSETNFITANEQLNADKLPNVWGVPVRPHDVTKFHANFDAPVYEFHISYQDLQRRFFSKDLNTIKDRKILVHAPELFAESKLLDLCAEDELERQQSLNNLQDVCNYCDQLAEILELSKPIKVITNVGGFSIHDFRHEKEKPFLYDRVKESLESLNTNYSEIIPQNMAPFPWHFGGQRFQNIFMVPEEIAEFCSHSDTKICLDTAHLSMYAKYSQRDYLECLDVMLPYIAHFHMSDASGLNGEGVKIGTGDVNFKEVLKRVDNNHTFIVETWQGHKNDGHAFKQELNYLNGLIDG